VSDPIRIAYLYPRDMNIYGDRGNVLTLLRRIEWHGHTAEVLEVHRGDRFPSRADIVIGGGGQDSGQLLVEADLQTRGAGLRAMADDGVPMLMVCGLYQLFGHRFRTGDGRILRGIDVLDVETVAGTDRFVGNVVAQSEEFGALIGYENHSGKTTLGPTAEPLARVSRGAGNNGSDGTEGARSNNVIGTYLHGAVLPKNPAIADHLISVAVERRFGPARLRALDESTTEDARRVAVARPR
jgi:CobQ-like glutamine amidotransferase family enzyme